MLETKHRFQFAFPRFVQIFAQAQHPLVLFLDDLQWADASSLELLAELLLRPNSRYLLLIGAFRDHEVDENHPLTFTLGELDRAGRSVHSIHLVPLHENALRELLQDTLHSSQEETQALASLVRRKTQGNPLFAQEFIKGLYEQNWLSFSVQQGRWIWELDKLQNKVLIDDVVDLFTQKTQKLPEDTQTTLQIASCIGYRFELSSLLPVVDCTKEALLKQLRLTVEEGLLFPLDDLSYAWLDAAALSKSDSGEAFQSLASGTSKEQEEVIAFQFAHDRIQQAVYSLVAPEKKLELHQTIGKILLETLSEEERSERIFEIVHHFNYVYEHKPEESQLKALAKLNLEAGSKAKKSAAFESAVKFFKVGLSCLSDADWKEQYELMLSLCRELVQVSFICANFDEVELWVNKAMPHVKDVLEQVPFYLTRILALDAQKRFREAIPVAHDILTKLDFRLPAKPTQAHVLVSLLQTRWTLSRISLKDIPSLPERKDPKASATEEIIDAILPSTYAEVPEMFAMILLQKIASYIRFGSMSSAAANFAVYAGVVLSGMLNDFKTSRKLYDVIQALQNRYIEDKNAYSKTCYSVYGTLNQWHFPIKDSLAPLYKNYREGLERGAPNDSALSGVFYVFHALYTGQELEKLQSRAIRIQQSCRQFKQEVWLGRLESTYYNFLIPMLQGEGGAEQLAFQESILQAKKESTDHTTLGFFWVNRCVAHVYLGHFEKAAEYAKRSEPYHDELVGLALLAFHHFYASLAHLQLAHTASRRERRKWLKKVRKSQKKLKRWAQHASANFLHEWHLLEAEHFRLLGQVGQAHEHYTQAISLAQKHGHLNEEALACEFAAQFYREQKQPDFERVMLQRAYYSYQQWGATAKLRTLEKTYPQLSKWTSDTSFPSLKAIQDDEEHTSPTESTTSTTGSRSLSSASSRVGSLDFISVLKSSQVLSSETNLQELLLKLIRLVSKNAGAQRGCLLLTQKHNLTLSTAANTTTSSSVSPHPSADLPTHLRPTDSSAQTALYVAAEYLPETGEEPKASSSQAQHAFPTSLVRFVFRSGRTALIDNLTENAQGFEEDPYIVEYQPRCILAMPISHKGETLGVLYLEHHQATSVFTPQRVRFLELLLVQIAISLTNAMLFSQLDEARSFAESANEAKSFFLAKMSHELRTPLNAIIGYSEMLQEDMEDEGLDEFNPDLERIQSSGRHLLSIVTNILDLTKIESGKLEFFHESFDVSQFMTECTDTIQHELSVNNNTLEWDCDAHFTENPLFFDKSKLRQILLNLLSNATKYTKNGTITISLKASPSSESKSPKQLHLSVADTGIGISMEQQEQIFDAFRQADNTYTRNYDGVGLGLAICRHLCLALKGKLSFHSQPGEGSTFFVRLPLQSDPTQS